MAENSPVAMKAQLSGAGFRVAEAQCMPFSPLRFRSRLVLAALAALFGAVAGCETVRTDPPAPPARSADAAPALAPSASIVPVTSPGKHPSRRDYYFVYHDVQ